MSGPPANGRFLCFATPPAAWATTIVQISVKGGSAGSCWNTRPVTYMGMSDGTDDRHKWWIHWGDNRALMHTLVDGWSNVPLSHQYPPFIFCRQHRLGWRCLSHKPSPTCYPTAAHPPSSLSAHTHIPVRHVGSHSGEAADCQKCLISPHGAVVLLTLQSEVILNPGYLLSQMN